jgi:hypothetical protein
MLGYRSKTGAVMTQKKEPTLKNQTNLPEGHRIEALAKMDYICQNKPKSVQSAKSVVPNLSKQSQIPSFIIENHGLLEKQTHLSCKSCLPRVLSKGLSCQKSQNAKQSQFGSTRTRKTKRSQTTAPGISFRPQFVKTNPKYCIFTVKTRTIEKTKPILMIS